MRRLDGPTSIYYRLSDIIAKGGGAGLKGEQGKQKKKEKKKQIIV